MNNKQGTRAAKEESMSRARTSEYEQDYQDALAYRRRLTAGTLLLAECSKNVLLENFDKLARAATAFRGLTLSEKS